VQINHSYKSWSSGLLGCVMCWLDTNVSEDRAASIFRDQVRGESEPESESLHNWRSVGRSVSQSVRLGVESPPRLIIRFWLQLRQLRFCLSWGVFPVERTSLSCNWSQSLSVSSYIYTYTFWFFFTFLKLFLVFYIQDVYVHTKPVSPGFVHQITLNTHMLHGKWT